MPARTQNATIQVFTKLLPCQRGHNVYSTCVDQTPKRLARTQNVSKLVDQTPPILTRAENSSKHVLQNPSHISEEAKCMCWPYPTHARQNKNASQIVLTKLVPCQWEDKMYLKMFWPNPSQRGHKIQVNKYWQKISILAGHKLYLNMFWPNSLHASEETNCISTCVKQTLRW
jgi:hypothetical protein